MAEFRAAKIAEIREQVGDGEVICGLSGGVDCAVAAVLIHEAIGEQLTCVFVDHGLMRRARPIRSSACSATTTISRWSMRMRETLFLKALPGVTDPRPSASPSARPSSTCSRPRRRRSAARDFLAQGTLYPDVIESVRFTGGPSVTIKSHHNVGGLPERMNMKLVEPLRELFKDEVRALGRELGLPDDVRQPPSVPRPGPRDPHPRRGHQGTLDILRKADAIYLEEIRNAGLYDAIWQAFAVLLPVRTRRRDGRRADLRQRAGAAGGDLDRRDDGGLLSVSPRVPGAGRDADHQRGRGINRVTYDYTSKPPGTIEWE